MNPPGAQAEAQTTNTGTEISAEVLATLAEIGEEVNSSLDLDEVLARSAALIKRHIDYEIFGVLLIEGDGAFLRHRFAIGYSPELAANLRIPLPVRASIQSQNGVAGTRRLLRSAARQRSRSQCDV